MISPKGCSWGESIPEQICLVYGRGHRQSPGLSGGGSRSDLEQDLGYRALDSASRLRVPECSLPDENYSNVLKLELRAGTGQPRVCLPRFPRKVADRQALSFPSGANFMNRPMG